jgi:hypothetical protein
MTPPNDDDDVRYGRPPKHSRYPKGTSGNRNRRYPKNSESRLQMMTRLLLRRVEITVSDEARKVTVLEAILLQLEHSDAPAASRIRLKYEVWAKQNSQTKSRTVFVDSDYTRALAGDEMDGNHDV